MMMSGAFQIGAALPGPKISTNKAPNYLDEKLIHYKMRVLIWPLENRIHEPVVDETGLTNFYDFDLHCTANDLKSHDLNYINLELGQFGVELVPANMLIQMLVVEKAK